MAKKYRFRFPFIKKNRFYNYPNERLKEVVFPTIYMYFKSFLSRIKDRDIPKPFLVQPVSSCSFNPKITWIGHSTFLVQIGNLNILTDPIFGNSTFLFKRILPPGIGISNLPKLDYIIISHNHKDHMDKRSMLELKNRFPNAVVLVPCGDEDWLYKKGFKRVISKKWWEDVSFNSGIKFTFLPAIHWSLTNFFVKNKALWGSWMIEFNGSKIFFAGDTGYESHFKDIGNKFGEIDLALLPIAPGEIRKWVKKVHMNSEDAIKAFLDLNAKKLIPMHWGTFYMGVDRIMQPVDHLLYWWKIYGKWLRNKDLIVLNIGQSIVLDYMKKIIIPKEKFISTQP